MKYFPETMIARGSAIDDASRKDRRVTRIESAIGTVGDDVRIAAEIARRWNACAGIDTAHLWPGAMGEMRGALAAMKSWWEDHNDPCGEPYNQICAILAKLGKTP